MQWSGVGCTDGLRSGDDGWEAWGTRRRGMGMRGYTPLYASPCIRCDYAPAIVGTVLYCSALLE